MRCVGAKEKPGRTGLKVPPRGIELNDVTISISTTCVNTLPLCGAESGAVVADSFTDTDFGYLKARWPHLPDDVIEEILTRIRDSLPISTLMVMS